MEIALLWEKIGGRASAINSKSDAHRALIAAALSDKPTTLRLSARSLDIEATLSSLSSLGAEISDNDDIVTVYPIKEAKNGVLDCKESGSTLRFLIPTAAALLGSITFIGRGRLLKRPLSPIISAMEGCGCSFSKSNEKLFVSGKLRAGTFSLPGNISSQFVSGLLFALPLLLGNSEIVLSSPLESAAYVDMTLDTLKKFQIEIKKTDRGFFVRGNQKYKSPKSYDVEGDWSNISPFLAAAALRGELLATGLSANSRQSDKAILDILRDFGAQVTKTDNGATVIKKNANPFRVDVSQCPDLFPVIAVLACGAIGKSVLFNAERLRLKESDRIASTAALIRALGGECEESENALYIYGKGRLRGGKCESANDHRIVMAAAVASAISNESVIISGAEAIDKSFPDFIKYFESTGGLCRVISNRN